MGVREVADKAHEGVLDEKRIIEELRRLLKLGENPSFRGKYD